MEVHPDSEYMTRCVCVGRGGGGGGGGGGASYCCTIISLKSAHGQSTLHVCQRGAWGLTADCLCHTVQMARCRNHMGCPVLPTMHC